MRKQNREGGEGGRREGAFRMKRRKEKKTKK